MTGLPLYKRPGIDRLLLAALVFTGLSSMAPPRVAPAVEPAGIKEEHFRDGPAETYRASLNPVKIQSPGSDVKDEPSYHSPSFQPIQPHRTE